ncbi:MAG: hypothetical protein ACM3S1_07425 [Hyphomicrobiales bacterium]
MLQLQSQLGNRHVARLVESAIVRRDPDDKVDVKALAQGATALSEALRSGPAAVAKLPPGIRPPNVTEFEKQKRSNEKVWLEEAVAAH